MAGVNRALQPQKESFYESLVYQKDESGICVFISHKSTDMEAAEAVANYLMSNNIDVYLDKMDPGLQQKVDENDSQGIVDSINAAIKCSTHIIVLVSDQTKESWWVPYEVGFSKSEGKNIASALLVGYVDGFPDYLKIERTIKSFKEFKDYAIEIRKKKKRYGDLFESTNINVNEPDVLREYIRSV